MFLNFFCIPIKNCLLTPLPNYANGYNSINTLLAENLVKLISVYTVLRNVLHFLKLIAIMELDKLKNGSHL